MRARGGSRTTRRGGLRRDGSGLPIEGVGPESAFAPPFERVTPDTNRKCVKKPYPDGDSGIALVPRRLLPAFVHCFKVASTTQGTGRTYPFAHFGGLVRVVKLLAVLGLAECGGLFEVGRDQLGEAFLAGGLAAGDLIGEVLDVELPARAVVGDLGDRQAADLDA